MSDPRNLKVIKSRRRPTDFGGVTKGCLVNAIYEILRTLIIPKVIINLSIESEPRLYSIADETGSNNFELQKYNLLLQIKPLYKEIGNLQLAAKAKFHYLSNDNQPIILAFEEPPEAIEAAETIDLKCLTPINFSAADLAKSQIAIQCSWDYGFAGRVYRKGETSIWGFNLEESLSLIRIGITKSRSSG